MTAKGPSTGESIIAMTKILPISGGVQSYDWGKLGSTSKAAQYAAKDLPGFTIDERKPYAEVRICCMDESNFYAKV
ncbi:MAG TPA: type I phosphomannose isomerase catalytic subunit [Chlamydiales bacterium]|nr:type I phosphomannose isomerase catalytic subunit [Chlamydiales bacterium]